MPKTLRLSAKEEEELRKRCIDFNKLLIKMNREPMKDSELAHAILEAGLKNVRLDTEGRIYIEA